jgi:hypothetical protein
MIMSAQDACGPEEKRLGHVGRGDPQAPGARDAAFKAFGAGSVSLKACLDKKDPPSKH